MCLVEGPPFARELNEIKNRFDTATFGDVFRDKKLTTLKRRVSWQTTPPSTPSMNYAAVASRQASSPSPSPAAQNGPSAPPPPNSSTWRKVLRNAAGQRVDSELNHTSAEFYDVKSRKLCHRFHLMGKCYFDVGCHYNHGDRLPPREREALVAVSRLSPCLVGLWCDDPNCVAGHRCARRECQVENCKFPDEMHGVDTQVVS